MKAFVHAICYPTGFNKSIKQWQIYANQLVDSSKTDSLLYTGQFQLWEDMFGL